MNVSSLAIAGLLSGLIGAGLAAAAEQKGVVRKVDAASDQLSIERDGKTQAFSVARDASLVRQEPGDKRKPAKIRVLETGLAGIDAGSTIEYRTETLDGKPVITSLKVTAVPSAPAEKKPAAKKPAKPAKKGDKKKNPKAAKKAPAKK